MSAVIPHVDADFAAKFRVQRKGGGKARVQHMTFEEAVAEASRLLSQFPQATFYILGEMARVRATAPSAAAGCTVPRDVVAVTPTAHRAASLLPNDLKPEDEAKVERLADIALSSATDVMVSAEMLMAAAAKIMVQNYVPAIALDLLERMMDGAREAVRETMPPSPIAERSWSAATFSGWVIDVPGYSHDPSVELEIDGLFVADFHPSADETGTSFLLVGVDRDPVPDASARLTRAITLAGLERDEG